MALARIWRAVDTEARTLTLTWQKLETYLFKHHAWPKLTSAQQRRLPEGAPLFAIDERLSVLYAMRQDLVPELQATPATTRDGALAKLDVLASVLDLTDHPEAHALLRSAQSDLAAIWR